MLFDKFWGVASNVVFLNYYNNLLKRKHIFKKPDNNNFHYIDKYFRIVIETMIMILYMHIARWSIIEEL